MWRLSHEPRYPGRHRGGRVRHRVLPRVLLTALLSGGSGVTPHSGYGPTAAQPFRNEAVVFQMPRSSLYCCVSESANVLTSPFASTDAVAQLLTQKRCALQ